MYRKCCPPTVAGTISPSVPVQEGVMDWVVGKTIEPDVFTINKSFDPLCTISKSSDISSVILNISPSEPFTDNIVEPELYKLVDPVTINELLGNVTFPTIVWLSVNVFEPVVANELVSIVDISAMDWDKSAKFPSNWSNVKGSLEPDL